MALTKITNDLLDLGSDTDALGLPAGTTAQRPSNPVEGTLRHNSEIDETKLETFDGTDWRKINKYRLIYDIDFLVVSGGGSGGSARDPIMSGGGGAGGFRTSYGTSGGNSSAESKLQVSSSTLYTVTIGAGGAGVSDPLGQGNNGTDSEITGADITSLTSIGGGGGGGYYQPGLDGGSGGGGCTSNGGGAGIVPGSGTSSQGFAGGTGPNTYSGAVAGGGGGASQVGADGGANYAPPAGAGNGGNGLANLITGTSTYYAGGGGGAAESLGGGYGYGGLGGGGKGGWNSALAGSGAANTGGGGGGGHISDPSGTGGSGIAILRIPTANYSGITTGSPTVTTDGTDTILTYTSSGTYTA